MSPRHALVESMLAALVLAACADAATIRIAAWNTLNNPDIDRPNEQEAFELVLGAMNHVDVLAVTETDKDSLPLISSIMAGLYPDSNYEFVKSDPAPGGDSTGVIYDRNTVTWIESVQLSEGLTQNILASRFQILDSDPVEDFVIYGIHLKSGERESAQRDAESQIIRSHADSLGNANVIYAGDFNMVGSSEPTWTNMLADGNGQAFDLMDSPGEWQDHPAFTRLHTHGTERMRSRFDLMLATGELWDGAGLEFISDRRQSFQVLGNNGSHFVEQPINGGSGAQQEVLDALVAASDHLPIIAEFTYFPDAFLAGDADRDFDFDQLDLVALLIAGKYLKGEQARWIEGDFDRNGAFDQLDIVAALETGNYLQGPYAAAGVPEPTAFVLFGLFLTVVMIPRSRPAYGVDSRHAYPLPVDW